jgi:hypothetical protein
MGTLLKFPKQYTDAQARRWARKADYRCFKTRGKQHFNNRGGYQLVDDDCNTVVAGRNFGMSAKDVVEFCKRELYGESMTDDGSDASFEPCVSPQEWVELIANVAVNLMESK